MKVTEQLLDFCNDGWGEDRIFIGANCFCVIDGATPITTKAFEGFHSTAEWMVENLVSHLTTTPSSCLTFPETCKEFINSTYNCITNTFSNDYDLPCLTVAGIQLKQNEIHAYVLGDCSIYILLKDGTISHVTDQRIAHFYQKTLQIKSDAIQKGKDPLTAVQIQKQKNKACMNQINGYWTVGYHGAFEKEFVTFNIKKDSIDSILLCTDGFDRLFMENLMNPADILVKHVSLENASKALRSAENSHLLNHVKIHDDATALLLTCK